MLATFLVLHSGTPYIYKGQEIGQINVPRSWGLDKYCDIETLNHWAKALREHPEDEELQSMMLGQYRAKARDNAGTPMQWDGSRNARFTGAERPWMDVHPDHKEWNVESQVGDPRGVFNYWQAVLELRKELKDVLVYGDFEMLDPENADSVAYARTFYGENGAMVVASFRGYEVEWQVPEKARVFLRCPVRLKNYEDEPQVPGDSSIRLRPFEALVFVRSG